MHNVPPYHRVPHISCLPCSAWSLSILMAGPLSYVLVLSKLVQTELVAEDQDQPLRVETPRREKECTPSEYFKSFLIALML